MSGRGSLLGERRAIVTVFPGAVPWESALVFTGCPDFPLPVLVLEVAVFGVEEPAVAMTEATMAPATTMIAIGMSAFGLRSFPRTPSRTRLRWVAPDVETSV